ncbi:MAG TPA: hemerythrin domain-containing protein [Streptosporangiaceae bacterium]|nr:hemerythrin domain-containing protein [Streptosporangiaceae bacterium]
MTDVFDVLAADHFEIAQMLSQLQTSTGQQSEGAAANGASRQELVDNLIIDASKHETAEKLQFWPAVRLRVRDGDRLARCAISQQGHLLELLAQLDMIEASEPEFSQLLDTFVPASLEHIAFEEEQVWPVLRRVLSPADSQDLGEKLIDAKKTAPMKPIQNTAKLRAR